MTYRVALEQMQIEYQSTENALSWIDQKFSQIDAENIESLNLSYIVKYKAEIGLVVSVDGAQNLTIKKPSLAIASLLPPALLYDSSSTENLSENNVHLFRKISLKSSERSPTYEDNYWVCIASNLLYLFYYQALNVDPEEAPILLIDVRAVNIKNGKIENQGWSVVPLMEDASYVNHGSFQLPLFEGIPPRVYKS